jgi:hypothetical protein
VPTSDSNRNYTGVWVIFLDLVLHRGANMNNVVKMINRTPTINRKLFTILFADESTDNVLIEGSN